MKTLITLVFILTAFEGYAQPDTNLLVNYEKENYGIRYPGSWTLDTSKKLGSEFFIFSPKENEQDKFSENVSLMIQDLNGQNMDLDKYAQISEEQIKTLATDGKIYFSDKMKAGNSEFYKIIYGMTQGIFKLKTEQYYFIRNNKAFVVTFSSELEKFDTFKATGEEILNSFILKQ